MDPSDPDDPPTPSGSDAGSDAGDASQSLPPTGPASSSPAAGAPVASTSSAEPTLTPHRVAGPAAGAGPVASTSSHDPTVTPQRPPPPAGALATPPPAADAQEAGPSSGRRRVRTPEQHKRIIAKRKRNLGESYINVSSHEVAARKVGPQCRDGCFEKVTLEGVKEIFESFWKMGNYDLQNAYIQKLVSVLPIARKRTQAEVSRRSMSRSYHVNINNESIKVCQKAFCSIHGISSKRVQMAIKKMTHTSVPLSDLRGKHTPSNKIASDRKDHVREHI